MAGEQPQVDDVTRQLVLEAAHAGARALPLHQRAEPLDLLAAAVAAGMRVVAVGEGAMAVTSGSGGTPFAGAWRRYPSLVGVAADLEEILSK